ncbi:phage major capsid protein [Klebsiella oxytoca]|uniref:phage major capsid protein n=1 Tax=Klebsiella oxytoca TaxID=571 RepID=UPI0022B7AE5B|nr:phage major capsid protein [Klebsiella oxytoca]EIY2867923.1 phage major capsid protein [Klebsiella oxytoca]EKQ7193178.1 phage major capsid protein [Klebsiella oxytoca]WBD80944.1 phage major capsid protein [Klebsiella oxytoca]HEJ7512012.1 phage major capsid protein [Klebsiella oxytoca]HEJ8258629.1 phage major capsid protein [Klebsiella oxytoca]
MPQIEELRRQRAGINEQVQALATIEASGGTLTAEQLNEFASLQQQFTDISAKMERLEAAERAAALVAKPVKATQQAPGIVVKQEPKQYTGAGMTRLVMAVAAGAGNLQDAAKFAAEELNDPSVSMAISTAASSGGVLIPQNLHSEVIELLRDRTIIRKLGARSIPLPNGNIALPRLAGGATASYTGENKDAKVSEARFDDVKLTAKTMIAMVPISNQLIGRAGFNVEQLVLQDILTAISVREDKAFMRDDGTGDTPTGMKARATEWNRLLPWEAAEINLNTIDEYLDKIILMAMDGNSNMISCGWGMSNRTYMKLYGLRDGNGNKVYPEMSQGPQSMLKGYPIQRTSAIPANLGTGGKESEIYFADFNDVVIGEDGNMKVDFSKEASYIDADGNLVSAFSRNQSLIRVITEHDIGFRHPEGLVLGTKVLF